MVFAVTVVIRGLIAFCIFEVALRTAAGAICCHFYPGGPGIAREMAKSKLELLDEGLGGGWAQGVGLGPRPGVGSKGGSFSSTLVR